nr:Chain C, HuD (G2L,I9V) peptide [synthetic construct]3PWJ_F Chain F, HuD (G2L,I9V) peptide [synthetic construct]
LLYGFVNYV